MSEKVINRNSNFELMRICSMLMIVFWHILAHGQILNNTAGTFNIFLYFLSSIIYIHVNSFVLLSGYFQSEKPIKLSKAIKINNVIWFYTAIIMIVFLAFFKWTIPETYIFKTLLPISFGDSWFFRCYLVLYLISPLLNTVIRNSNQEKMKKAIVTLLIVFSILPYLTRGTFFDANDGVSLYNFILLYFIGAYLKRYPLKDSIFKEFSIKKQRIILVISFFTLASFNFLLYNLGCTLSTTSNGLISEISVVFKNGFLTYNNPIVILQCVVYFCIFNTYTFQSKIINKIATCTFGVYIISDNNLVRQWIYNFLGFNCEYYTYSIIGKLLLSCILIFSVCALIEIIRLKIFKIIYNTN